jgi:hypothetical protein
MGCVPEFFLSAVASPDGWPKKGRHIGGQKAECFIQGEVNDITIHTDNIT